MKAMFFFFLILSISSPSFSSETLLILSPHRKSIQEEFIPRFKEFYEKKFKTKIDVDWIDQGGTADDVRFLRAKFAKNGQSSGLDIFWGGGTSTFIELKAANFLAETTLSPELLQQIPESVGGVPQYDKSHTWYGTALSSFGIFYNKRMMTLLKISPPQSWSDLGNYRFFNNIMQTDPRRSGTATTLNNIILQSQGWKKGWEQLIRIGANTERFTHSSSDPIKGVVSGNVPISLAIDFYALAKISEVGESNISFILPQGETILDTDPIAMLKGAPHPQEAQRFISWVLSPEAQMLLVLPKGTEGGPRIADLGRMSVNKEVYKLTEGKRISAFNPFVERTFFSLDLDKAAKLNRILADLIGAIIIDPHNELKNAWKAINLKGARSADINDLCSMPLSEQELIALLPKWHDEVLRNKTINTWLDFAQKKYKRLQKEGDG